jgi:hypothetical protein
MFKLKPTLYDEVSDGGSSGGTSSQSDGNASSTPASPSNAPSKPGFNPFAPSTHKPSAGSEPSVNADGASVARVAPAASGAIDASKTGLGAGGATGDSGAPVSPGVPFGAAAPPAQPAVVPQVNLSPEAIAALRQQSAPQGGQPARPQVTDAEFKRQFNVVEVDPAMFEGTFGFQGSPQQVASLNNLLQASARQAVTITRHLLEQQKSEIMAAIAPVQQTITQQTEERMVGEFYGEYPHLREYHTLCQEIVAGIRARGQKFNSPKEAYKFVAETAVKLAKINVTPQAPGAPATTQQPSVQPAVSRPMTTTSVGGRSGTGGSATPQKTTAERVFG